MADPSYALEVDALTTQYGDVVAVDAVNLVLEPGELVALVGPSGCGKSTLLRSIAGLVDPAMGTIRIGSKLVDDGKRRLPPEDRSAGLVFQDHALFPHLTVSDNIGFGLRSLGGSPRQRRIREMLGLVDLSGYGERFPHELSGGERQRVSLARAMAPDPDIMLFDEPFASLDANLRVQLRQHVVQVLRETQTPSVFVTHDQREALAIGDRIAVMRNGSIAQIGTAEQVFHNPADDFVGAFMGDASFLQLTQTDGEFASVLGPLPLHGADPRAVWAMTRPDDVAFSPSAQGTARIVQADYTGTHWLAVAESASGERIKLLTSHLQTPSVGDCGELSLIPGHRQVVVPRRT